MPAGEVGVEVSLIRRHPVLCQSRPAAPDDVLDAIVAAWSARRWAEGAAGRLPPDPPVDARGLRMEIVY